MASFDFTGAVSQAYVFVWTQRRYLFRLSLPVFFIKILSFLIIFLLRLDQDFLRQGLILFPSLFFQGVFLIGLVRYANFAEPISLIIYPSVVPDTAYRPRRVLAAPYQASRTNLQAGILIYALLNLFKSLFVGLFVTAAQGAQESQAQESLSLIDAVSVLIVFCGIIWGFRLFWIHIPAALGYPVLAYLKKIRTFQDSIALIAIFFLVHIPLSMISVMLMEFFSHLFSQMFALKILAICVIQSLNDLVIESVIILAMSFGIIEILDKKSNP